MKFLSHVAASALFLSASSAGHAEDAGRGTSWYDKNAARIELRMGILSYDTGLFTTQAQEGVVINGELLFPSPDFLTFIGSPRPYVGVDFAPAKSQVDFLYAGLNWEAYLTDRLYLTGSLGGSIHNAADLTNPVGYKALGCRVLFHLGAGIGFDIMRDVTVQLYADHFSNANLCSKNAGAEAAGVRFGYRF